MPDDVMLVVLRLLIERGMFSENEMSRSIIEEKNFCSKLISAIFNHGVFIYNCMYVKERCFIADLESG